jgi:hypothetical protein
MMAAAQIQLAGQMIQAQDTDTTGTDDIVGKILVTLGKATNSFALGDVTKVNDDLKVVADAIYDYLGITPPA